MAIKIRKRHSDNDRNRDGANTHQDTVDAESSEPKVGVAPAGSDPILDATMQGVSWMERNRGLIIGGVALVVVAVVGGWIYTSYSHSQHVQASSALSPALWDYEVLTQNSPVLEQIKQSDIIGPPEKIFPTEAARWHAIYEEASSALAQNSTGAIAQSARLTKAAAALHLQKNDEAITLYNQYLEGQTSAAVLPFVYLGLANAYAGKEQVDKAAANLEKLSQHNEAYAQMAAFQKAKLYDGAGNVDKARELYQQILETNPKTPHRDAIERRLALL